VDDSVSPEWQLMTWRRLLYLGTMVLWVILLAFVVKGSVDRLQVPPWGNATEGESLLEMVGGTRVGQGFVAPLPGLYRIDVTLQSPGTGRPQAIVFHLKSSPDAGQDIWTTTFSSDELQNGSPLSFDFPVLRDSREHAYYFYLEATGATSASGVAVGYNPGTNLDRASAYIDGQPVDGDLQFQTFYSLRTRDKAYLLLSRVAEGRPYMLGSKGLYIGLGLGYVLVLCIFLVQIAGAIWAEQDEEA
jgi:hypothetical protein